MSNRIIETHVIDEKGNPTGGKTVGTGIAINWQTGPLGRGKDRTVANGAFVESVILAALGRLRFYQSSKFKCRENEKAIGKLEEAGLWLMERTNRRDKCGVEGTHRV